MDESEIAAVEQALSLERYARYLDWAAGNRSRAIALYTLNAQLLESLYIPMQMLEIALRNRIHRVMTAAMHEQWYDEPRCQLGSRQAEQFSQAKQDLLKAGRPATPGRVVAALSSAAVDFGQARHFSGGFSAGRNGLDDCAVRR